MVCSAERIKEFLNVKKYVMKKLLLVFTIVFAGILNSIAQPNPGFENWSTVYNYQSPDGWANLNFLSILPPFNPLSAIKATGIDKHSGNYALKIKTIFVSNNPAPDRIDDTVGLVFTGKVNISPPSYKYGFPFTDRPEKLKFWSKYTPVGNDTGGVRVILLKYHSTGRDTVAMGELFINETENYTLFQCDLTYYTNETPDTAAIIFGSSKHKAFARVGSTLYVDDVSFSGWVGIEQHDLFSVKVKTFPNPATDVLNILAQFDEAYSVKVIDVSGKPTGVYKIQNYCAKINTTTFADGVYFFEIRDKKEKILTKGKFNIIK